MAKGKQVLLGERLLELSNLALWLCVKVELVTHCWLQYRNTFQIWIFV